LHNSSFIVGKHNADQLRILTYGTLDIRRIYQAAGIHRNVCYLVTFRRKIFAGVEDGMMFNRRADDVIAGARDAKDCEVICFRTAAGEYDL
jgi:hypothetical protein